MSRRVKELQMNEFAFKPSLNPEKLKKKKESITEGQPIELAKSIVFKQMQIEGLRTKTLITYKQAFEKFIEFVEVYYVEEIDRVKLLQWLESLNYLDATTKANRYRFICAILGRFYDNKWLTEKFWKGIRLKVNKKTQQNANENELEVLLSLIDTTKWIGFRDVTALLLLYRTGIRIQTLVSLREHHIDYENKELALSGEIMKNGRNLHLPLDDELLDLLNQLIKQNKIVRNRYKVKNDFVFITKSGLTMQSDSTNNNAMSKRINHYAKTLNLKSISPHKIRRLYAKNLLNKGANIAVISRALGHSSLAVTERYIQLSEKEISDTLRGFL